MISKEIFVSVGIILSLLILLLVLIAYFGSRWFDRF
jgi:hypothetical protein